MKKSKLFILIILVVMLTGCFKKNSLESANIKVTNYPIEYITHRLYGKNSTIKSIYPDSMDKNYEVSEKLLKDYSSSDLFIFNGNEDKENNYMHDMFSKNGNLKIIDATASLTYTNKMDELWMDPMNCLTMANNIKKGFQEYITTTYLNNEIENNYKNLKIELMQLEADYRETANRANNKNIIVGDDLFLYLNKYGINVISLEKNKNYSKKSEYTAEELIKNGEVKIIYTTKDQKENEIINKLKENYDIKIVELNTFYTISEEDRKSDKNYFDLMYSNLELLKEQLYN